MSKYEQAPGRGVLLSKEKQHEKAPDYKGTLTLDQDYKAGDQIKLSAWTKQSRVGQLISIAVDNWKPSGEQANKVDYDKPRQNWSGSGSRKIIDDDVPF